MDWEKEAFDLKDRIKELGEQAEDKPCDTVVITGYAQYTPLGNTSETAAAEFRGQTGTRKMDVQNFRTNIAGPIDFKPEDHFSEKELRGIPQIGALGIFLAREAGHMASLLDENSKLKKQFDPLRAGCTVASGIGASTKMVDIHEKIHWKTNPETGKLESIDPKLGSSLVSPFIGLQLFPEEMGGDIEAFLGLSGWGINSSEACATGLSSLVDAYHLIKTGKNDIVFAGGIENGLSERPELSIGVFAAMRGPLSSRNDQPEKASRPFDRDRDGFVLSAGGAVIVLERLDTALARKAKILGVILGAEKGSDGYNPTNLNPERVAKLILKTIQMPDNKNLGFPVDSIFAHATSTKAGDAAEINTLRKVFGDEYLRKIPITAIKSMHGHLAGGAGAVNAVSAIRALEKGFIPPIANLENVDEPFKDLNLVRGKALQGDFKTALILAYGFHGKDASVLLGKYQPQSSS
jgi:3-oxoacyl-[acyl-carrier-protein] synthase II